MKKLNRKGLSHFESLHQSAKLNSELQQKIAGGLQCLPLPILGGGWLADQIDHYIDNVGCSSAHLGVAWCCAA